MAKVPEKVKVLKILEQPADSLSSLWDLTMQIETSDVLQAEELFATLASNRPFSHPQSELKFQWLRSRWILAKAFPEKIGELQSIVMQSLRLASQSDVLPMLAEFSIIKGSLLNYAGQKSEALTYLVQALHIRDSLGINSFPNPERFEGVLVLILFSMGEYERCIFFSKRLFELGKNRLTPEIKMNSWNTVGVCYRRLGNYDSARVSFDSAQYFADLNGENTLWEGIISGNYGQLLLLQGKPDSARLLLEKDYVVNAQWNEWANAANALQWLARIDLQQGQIKAAQKKVHQALALLNDYPRADYLEFALFTAADVHRVLGQTDSFYYYLNRYVQVKDSLAKILKPDIVEIINLQLDKEVAEKRNNRLESKRQEERLWRNGLILLVLVITGSAIWIQFISRKRLEAERKLVKIREEAAQINLKAAKEKLNFFTQILQDKNEAIADMETELQKIKGVPEEDSVRTLSEGTLLTDNDWEKFRELFEVPYPGFLFRLKQKYPAITPAEIRMAALIRLNLSAKEMASMLGISTMSVYKSRQRLRQRMGVQTDTELEATIGLI